MPLLWDSYEWESYELIYDPGQDLAGELPRWNIKVEWTDGYGGSSNRFFGNHRWVLWMQMAWWVWATKYPGVFITRAQDWIEDQEPAVWAPIGKWLVMTIDLPLQILDRIIMNPPKWLR